jgi:hypothetical protein
MDTGFIFVAEEGYCTRCNFTSIFLPLLPLMIRAVTSITHDTIVSGFLISNFALLIASMILFRLVGMEGDESLAVRSVWYLLIFPMSLFGSAIYSESLFLLGAIGSYYLARKGYWESAAMVGFLTTLTRFLGLIVAPMLLVEWLVQRKRNPVDTKPKLVSLLVLLTVPLGTILYMIYLNQQFGDPLAFVHASSAWGRELESPINTIRELIRTPAEGWRSAITAGRIAVDNWTDLLAVIFFAGLGIVLLRQRRWSESVFVLAGSILPISTALLMSQRRYMWVLFPAYILLARWGKNPWVDKIITTIFILGLGLYTAMFANWYWVG